MAKDFSEMEDSNRSSNRSIHEVIETSRRAFLKSGAVVSLASVMAPLGAQFFQDLPINLDSNPFQSVWAINWSCQKATQRYH
jgi:secreted PhoX family phosphatase